jgi:hypothetical protein
MNDWDRRKPGQSDAARLADLVSPYGPLYRRNWAIVRRAILQTAGSEEDRVRETAEREEWRDDLLAELADLQRKGIVDAGKGPTRQSNSGQREVIGTAPISKEDGQGNSISTSHDQGEAK